MTDAPERIWAHQAPDRPLRLWRLDGSVKGSTEYVRADVAAAMVAAALGKAAEAASRKLTAKHLYTEAQSIADTIRARGEA